MSWMLFPDNPALSALVLGLIAIIVLYAARTPVHGVIRGITRAASSGLRIGARGLSGAATRLRERNRVVLLAHGREEAQQELEREFDRVSAMVQRDLGGYPALQRRLLDELTRIEEDYKKCGDVPPPPPEWIKAVETISGIQQSGDGLVQKILEDIAKSINRIYDRLLADYRRSYEERHKILKGFMPFWRSLEQTLGRVDRDIAGLHEGATKIDALMEKYREIEAASPRIEHALTSSAAMQMAIATFVLLIAFGGAFVNFWLIQRPVSAMVGAGEYIVGNLEASHIAAMVLILMEAAMGLFLMESMRITHLFPRINALNEKTRTRMVWASFIFLLCFSLVEVALAVARDYIMEADLALKHSLSSMDGAVAAAQASVSTGWMQKIPAVGQMILGFILPFALAFIAIPLEYFIVSGRTVLGVALVLALQALGLTMRVMATIFKHLGSTLTMLYDTIIFLPVLIERMVRGGAGGVGVRQT